MVYKIDNNIFAYNEYGDYYNNGYSDIDNLYNNLSCIYNRDIVLNALRSLLAMFNNLAFTDADISFVILKPPYIF